MRKVAPFILLVCGFLLVHLTSHAQEDPLPDIDIEQSADVFLEAYSDEFQEVFFEALKQKGIENYDKALNLFLKCKQLDATDPVVDHELAKLYYASGQYPLSEDYAMTAVNAEADNLWYTETLVRILQKQGKSPATMKAELPFGNGEFNQNLAQAYFDKQSYETALAILKTAEQNRFTAQLTSRIKDSIEKRDNRSTQNLPAPADRDTEPNPLDVYRIRIEALMRSKTYTTLQEVSEEALEGFPSQPYFYYALGYALNNRGKPSEAIETLETALDYLIDDVALSNKIYRELGNAHTTLGNTEKANTYLRKIEPGF